jgi:hypothetical protein
LRSCCSTIDIIVGRVCDDSSHGDGAGWVAAAFDPPTEGDILALLHSRLGRLRGK